MWCDPIIERVFSEIASVLGKDPRLLVLAAIEKLLEDSIESAERVIKNLCSRYGVKDPQELLDLIKRGEVPDIVSDDLVKFQDAVVTVWRCRKALEILRREVKDVGFEYQYQDVYAAMGSEVDKIVDAMKRFRKLRDILSD